MSEKLETIKNKINKIITKKNILIGIIIISVLLLIPIIKAALYTHPSADDFNYGIKTINKIQSEGILAVFFGAFEQVIDAYNSWQGTYSAVMLFALNPSVFGDNFYFMTTIIILVSLFFSLYYVFKQSAYKLLKLDKISFYILLFLFFLLSIETLPSKVEGLYWWNGASYYMLFFSLELIQIGILIKRYFLNNKTKLNYIILCVLIFLIGGGNYIVALQQIIILFLLNIFLIVKYKNKGALPLLILAIISLGISAIAPGNAARAAGSIGMNPIKAILLSFYYAVEKLFSWINPLNLSIICLLVGILSSTYKRVNYKFSHPILFVTFAYCIFAAEFTPTLFAQSGLGEGRLWNIMYISMLLLIGISMYYVIGYLRNKLINQKVVAKEFDQSISKFIKTSSITIFIIFIAIILPNLILLKNNLTSYQTFKILYNGQAKQYDEEYNERLKILHNKKIKNVEFKEFSNYPVPIFYSEFSEDKNSWLNTPAAEIYNKNYIKLVK